MRRTIIMALIILGLCAFLLLAGPAACNKWRSMRAQNDLQQGQTEALTNSAVDAIETRGDVSEREKASDELTRTNEKDIQNAEGATEKVKAPVDRAGRNALCLRDAYRNSEQCRLLRASSGLGETR